MPLRRYRKRAEGLAGPTRFSLFITSPPARRFDEIISGDDDFLIASAIDAYKRYGIAMPPSCAHRCAPLSL